MKEALLKKRLGIPAALLVLLVSASVATACLVVTFSYTVITHEPLSFTEKDGLDITWTGGSDDIVIKVLNNSPTEEYGILVDADVVKGQVDSITYSDAYKVTVEGSQLTYGNDGDRLDAKYNIGTYGTDAGCYNIVVTVDSADDVPPGTLKVLLEFHREAKYP